jgi:hypothetical protein
MATERLALPYIASAQAQKHVTHNAALDMLDGLVPGLAVSASTAAAPTSPAAGECYIVPAGGTFGAVSAGALALYAGGAWVEVPATFGQRVLVLDEGRHRVFAGSRGWVPGAVIGQHGGTLGLRCLDLEADISAGGVTVTLAAAIPARVIVLGVTAWVVTDIAGPTQFKVGLAGEPDKFGGYIWHEAPASNIGVVGPFATYADTDLLLTAQDGATAFTAGTVRLSILILEPGAAPA